MIFIDIIFLIVYAYFIFKGIKNGLIKEFASLLAIILGVFLAIRFYDYLIPILEGKTSFGLEYLPILAFVIIFIATIVLVFIFAKLLNKFIKLIKLQWLNKLGGVVFAILKISLILGGLLFFINQLNEKVNVFDITIWNNSILYKFIMKIFNIIFPYTKDLTNLF
ncbi:MAG: CvpA family protein [Bacteroidales bacterium]|nr:CvpA family protein [Bacteroidales bacterium]MCK9498096.1 CvpA family protein [Bacteroidales bacterium]MDY0313586.1 CvpA family protein [Bacteroidales bacterium]NLB86968.1 CvpA family protein [Bacteroidales bacterium]NLB87019.1 CvpA family protein [Bacteroidales bacterium]